MRIVVDEGGVTLYGVHVNAVLAINDGEAICSRCARRYLTKCKHDRFDCGSSDDGVVWMTADNATAWAQSAYDAALRAQEAKDRHASAPPWRRK